MPDSLGFLNGSGDAVKTLRHRFPVLGHFHHPSSVQHAVAKQVVKLQTHAVPPPLVYLIVELVPLGGQDGQVLHIPPCQIGAVVVKKKKSIYHGVFLREMVDFASPSVIQLVVTALLSVSH